MWGWLANAAKVVGAAIVPAAEWIAGATVGISLGWLIVIGLVIAAVIVVAVVYLH